MSGDDVVGGLRVEAFDVEATVERILDATEVVQLRQGGIFAEEEREVALLIEAVEQLSQQIPIAKGMLEAVDSLRETYLRVEPVQQELRHLLKALVLVSSFVLRSRP